MHKPLKFDQVSLHKTLEDFQNDDRVETLSSPASKTSFWKPTWEHSVVHSEPGLVEFEQLEISINVFRGRFIEAFLGLNTFSFTRFPHLIYISGEKSDTRCFTSNCDIDEEWSDLKPLLNKYQHYLRTFVLLQLQYN